LVKYLDSRTICKGGVKWDGKVEKEQRMMKLMGNSARADRQDRGR
jgi:hypothetical protein